MPGELADGVLVTYTPTDFRNRGFLEVSPEDVSAARGPVLARGLRLKRTRFWAATPIQPEAIGFQVHGVDAELAIPAALPMRFGTETVSAKDYFERVVEPGDKIDVITWGPLPKSPGTIMLHIFWIHIIYEGEPREAGREYKAKDDGLFAYRAKAGEKVERKVCTMLRDRGGHPFREKDLTSPGHFVIRYGGKGKRTMDRICPACELKFEVKRRVKDWRFRVSHSDARPFVLDNPAGSWHAFVFPDRDPCFIRSEDIATAIDSRRFRSGSDEFDVWVDIDRSALTCGAMPKCQP